MAAAARKKQEMHATETIGAYNAGNVFSGEKQHTRIIKQLFCLLCKKRKLRKR